MFEKLDSKKTTLAALFIFPFLTIFNCFIITKDRKYIFIPTLLHSRMCRFVDGQVKPKKQVTTHP
jgi:hypothetical protein